MKNSLLPLFAFGLIISCSINKVKGDSVYPPIKEVENKSGLATLSDTLTITALDLSEDMSRLSTKNDEVFLFIYDYSDTNSLSAPLVSVKHIFDKNNPDFNLSIPRKDRLILFFIEEDSFRNIEQVEPVIRVYFKEIMKATDYNQLMKFLGEDDLLGVKIIDNQTKKFTLSGMNSLDKFNYSFVIK